MTIEFPREFEIGRTTMERIDSHLWRIQDILKANYAATVYLAYGGSLVDSLRAFSTQLRTAGIPNPIDTVLTAPSAMLAAPNAASGQTLRIVDSNLDLVMVGVLGG